MRLGKADRFVRQPGPPSARRILAVPCGMVPLDVELPAGMRLLDALAAFLGKTGAESACLTLSGGSFSPFAYVIPSAAQDEAHAAFYSDVFCPEGASLLEFAAVTLGWREGKPWFHCHGCWLEHGGKNGCGHVLPADTWISSPVRATGAGMIGARFEVQPDAETGFDLLSPVPTGTSLAQNCRPALALRLAPNQPLASSLQAAGRAAGFASARVHGGVASLIGVRFDGAPPLAGYATEVLLRSGMVECDAGAKTRLVVSAIDYLGQTGTGRLAGDDNVVLMTFEGLLEQA